MLNKTQYWVMSLFLSFNISLSIASRVDYNFTQDAKEIKGIKVLNNTQYYLESQRTKPIRLASDNDSSINQSLEFKNAIKNKLNNNTYPHYFQSKSANNKKNNNLGIKSAVFIFDYTLNLHKKVAQSSPKRRAIELRQPLISSTVINRSEQTLKTNFNENKKSDVSIYNINEIDRLDLAYIEEELLYSKEARVLHVHDDTSEAIRLLTFNSLDLDDRSLISIALLLICALVTIAIYVRYFRY